MNISIGKISRVVFEEPIIIQSRQARMVSFKTNGWVRKTINSMNQKLSFEEIRLYLMLPGQDANANEIRIRIESAPI